MVPLLKNGTIIKLRMEIIMKCSNTNARIDKAGKHNDRNFNIEFAPHIDKNAVEDNVYYAYDGEKGDRTLVDIEMEYYRQHFSDKIEVQNKKNDMARHSERNKTIEEYYHAKNTRPEDKILQIGNIKKHATPEELWECAMAYKDRFEALYGDRCKILDMAMHVDEPNHAPHVHVRRVWVVQDDKGLEYVSQTKALEQLGITAPNAANAISKTNNAKMTITATDQKLFQDICIERGLDIDITPEGKRKHLDQQKYTAAQLEKEIAELTHERDFLRSEIDIAEESKKNLIETIDTMLVKFEEDPFFGTVYFTELEEAKKKSKSEQFKVMSEIYADTMKKRAEEPDLGLNISIAKMESSRKLRHLKEFIEKQGLSDKYEQYEILRNEEIKVKRETKEKGRDVPESYF